MSNLVEVVKENVGNRGRSSHMLYFFQGLIKSGALKAYFINGRLIPTDELMEQQPFVIEDLATKHKYALRISSEGGMIYDDGDSQTMYYHCVLEKLAKITSRGLDGVDERTIKFGHGNNVLSDLVSARLRVDCEDDWASSGEEDYIAAERGRLIVEGENDGLFAKVREFVGDISKQKP